MNAHIAVGAELPDFDDSGWEVVSVPHDWAIKGPFDKNNDIQIIKIVEDGVEKIIEHSGKTGGLPHAGKGWYRNTFSVSGNVRNKRFFIEFDGVMANSKVYLNGKFVGSWPYGYASFCFELTDHVRFDAENSSGQASTIWVSRHRITTNGPAAARTSASLTYADCPKTDTIPIEASGERILRHSTSFLIGTGRVWKEKLSRYIATQTTIARSYSLTANHKDKDKRTLTHSMTGIV